MDGDIKIKKVSTSDMVYDRLKQFILDGTWVTGQKIPTEVELAKELGVNRLTVRIALQRLSALGLLDIRVGDGTYVKEFDLNLRIAELSEFYVNEKAIQDVVEYRLALELACVQTAVVRYTEDELEHFGALCRQFQEELQQYYLQTDPEKAKQYFLKTVETSCDLHTTLCGMTHNDLINYALMLAKEPMRRHMEYNASHRLQDFDSDRMNIWAKRWNALYEALKARDAETCSDLLRQIIQL